MAMDGAEVVGQKTAESYKDASAGIDTMMNALIDRAALITKHWKLVANPGAEEPPFYLTVRHYSMTKMYILSISGLLVLVNSKVVYRHTDPIEDKLEVPFTLSGKTGKLVIEVTADTKEKKNKVFTCERAPTPPPCFLLRPAWSRVMLTCAVAGSRHALLRLGRAARGFPDGRHARGVSRAGLDGERDSCRAQGGGRLVGPVLQRERRWPCGGEAIQGV